MHTESVVWQCGTRTERTAAIAGSREQEEQRLIARAKNGFNDAVEQLVRRYESRLFRIARNMTRTDEDARDVVQDAFVKAFRNLAAFRGDARFYAWLVRIAVNEALMLRRKDRRTRYRELSIDDPATFEQIPWAHVADSRPSPEDICIQQERQRILFCVLNALPPGMRQVLCVHTLEKHSVEEAARMLGLSVPAAKSRLKRGRRAAREKFRFYTKRGS